MYGKNKALLIVAPMLAVATIFMLNTISSSYLKMEGISTKDEISLKSPGETEKVEEGSASIASKGEEGVQKPFAYTMPKEAERVEYMNNILPYIIGVVSASVIFVILNKSKSKSSK